MKGGHENLVVSEGSVEQVCSAVEVGRRRRKSRKRKIVAVAAKWDGREGGFGGFNGGAGDIVEPKGEVWS